MGSLDLDVLAGAVRAELAEHPVSRVVLDSLAELVDAARESERFAAFMRSLVGLIRAAGSSAVVTSETAPYGIADRSLDGLMFLFDNIVDLRYIEKGSQIGRALSVLKMPETARTRRPWSATPSPIMASRSERSSKESPGAWAGPRCERKTGATLAASPSPPSLPDRLRRDRDRTPRPALGRSCRSSP